MSGQRARGDRIVEQRLLAHEGADDELAVALLDRVEARDAVDVDERARLDAAQLHERHQALTAGQHRTSPPGSSSATASSIVAGAW